MQAETRNPGASERALTGLGIANLAGCDFENTTPSVVINRLRHRFGYSAQVAALLAELAGIGPQVRS